MTYDIEHFEAMSTVSRFQLYQDLSDKRESQNSGILQ